MSTQPPTIEPLIGPVKPESETTREKLLKLEADIAQQKHLASESTPDLTLKPITKPIIKPIIKPITKPERKPKQNGKAEKETSTKLCANCNFELDGPFCGRCGQPEQSMIRFFGSVVMHFLDDVFGFDSRAGRTLFPLIFRPGFLTNEYIRGRRVHYVPPLRLYFFISIVFFLLLGFFTDDSVKDLVKLQQGNTESVKAVNEELKVLQKRMSQPGYVLVEDDNEELTLLLNKQVYAQKNLRKNIAKTQKEVDAIINRQAQPDYVPDAADQLGKTALSTAVTAMREHLGEPIAQLEIDIIDNRLLGIELRQKRSGRDKEAKKKAKLEAQKAELLAKLTKGETPFVPAKAKGSLEFGMLSINLDDEEKKVAPTDGPVNIGVDPQGNFRVNLSDGFDWLTDEQNKRLADFAEELEKKGKKAVEQDASPLIQQVLGVLPQMMFFLLPIFALLLKIYYLFAKRYYMEHLTVALHSHAFLFLVLILLATLSMAGENLIEHYPQANDITEGLSIALLLWSPVYLFIMQKRVYKQGFVLTFVKFGMVGISYFALMMLTTSVAFVWGLAKL